MSAIIVDGKRVAERIRAGAAERAGQIGKGAAAPGLSVVLVGDNPASALYVRNKGRMAERLGIRFTLHTRDEAVGTADLVRLVRSLAEDDGVDAILVQLPLPSHVDTDSVIDAVDPRKDADGLHPENLGRLAAGRPALVTPCTPAGCMELLHEYGVPIAGSRAVVVGRSTIVGRPLAILLTNADATVTIGHSKTQDLPSLCRDADILVAAIGKPLSFGSSHVKPGACVIDVGVTPTGGGVVGDVDRAAVEPIAGWLTPVPGGVGPMTIAMLMRNTVTLAAARRRVAAV